MKVISSLVLVLIPKWLFLGYRKWCPQWNYLLFHLQDISTVQNVCHEETLKKEKVNQNKNKKVKHTFVKTFPTPFIQDNTSEAAKVFAEETQTFEGEEVTYL